MIKKNPNNFPEVKDQIAGPRDLNRANKNRIQPVTPEIHP